MDETKVSADAGPGDPGQYSGTGDSGAGAPELLPNQVMLFGEVHTLKPLVGRQARLMFPKALDLIGAAISAALSSGLSLDKIQKGEIGLADIAVLVMTLGRFLTSEQWERFETELLPFILGVDATALEDQGDIIEVYYAAYLALRYHAQVSVSKPQMQALRKLFSEADRRKNSHELEVPAAEAA